MASGSKRKRGNDEYIFIDGRALRADEAVRIDLSDTLAPGQAEAEAASGASSAAAASASMPAFASSADAAKQQAKPKASRKSAKETLADMASDDAFALTDDAAAGSISFERAEDLMRDDRRKMRLRYAIFGGVLLLAVITSLCMSSTSIGTWHSPAEVAVSIGQWFHLTYLQIFQPSYYMSAYRDITHSLPFYADCMLQIWLVFKYLVCGAMLAISGMLYQNTFRNPIAAPSMLGVSNGISFALLILVLQYGYQATDYPELYFSYSIVGGIVILLLVMLGGKWISGKGRFNVVNMILMGTIMSQLLGIVINYAQAFLMDDAAWDAYYILQNATGSQTVWNYVSVIIGAIVAFVPIVLFRFKLNLISFSDDESRLLGVNPNKLRLLSLGCGSLMILIAQLNLGQVAMASLIIPFIVRAVFGSEFRKQLAGNLLVGALVLLVCGDLGVAIKFDGYSIGIGAVVNIVAIPLFVWMLAIRQRSWE